MFEETESFEDNLKINHVHVESLIPEYWRMGTHAY